MIYHWDGYEPYRLTHRGPPERTYNVSGQSLVVLRQTVNGPLAGLSRPLQFGPGAAGAALLSGSDIVMQVRAEPGWQTVGLPGFGPQSSPRITRVEFIDALTGEASSRDDVALTWDDQMLKVRFKVPGRVNGAGNNPPKHLAYVVVRRAA
jgi:hypothetical protein